MALMVVQGGICCFVECFKELVWSLLKMGSQFYDWTNACRKLSIVVNPLMLLSDRGCGAALAERDLVGALLCFALLAWALALTGRSALVGVAYSALLTGVVGQYVVLHRSTCTELCGQADALRRAADADGCRKAKEQGTALAWERAGARPGLEVVASAVSFCSLPLAVCSLLLYIVGKRACPELTPVPAAWCTLLASCALLPDAPHCKRGEVILPCGVLFTFLALLFFL